MNQISHICSVLGEPHPTPPLCAPCPDPRGIPGWYAAYTTPRHEKCVIKHMHTRGIEHFLPLYFSQRKWADGSRATLELPLFPSYVFVRIPRRERVRVLEVPGVLSIVGGTGGEPALLPAEQIEALRNGLTEERVEPHPYLVKGQRGRILSGALAGMEGVVERLQNRFRVVLTVEMIMQSVAVEVDVDNVMVLPAA